MSGEDIVRRPRSCDEMPSVIPVFPLAGALILPATTLPLNVFEPRYLAMVQDALASPERLIGMIQPKEPESQAYEPPLYTIGCAGRIVSFAETPDARYLITLAGICRFKVLDEIERTTPYRLISADFSPFGDDFADEDSDSGPIDRTILLERTRRYIETLDLKADWESIEKTDTAALVNWLAVLCPFGPREKQALLEAPDLASRAATMESLLEMAIAGDGPEHSGIQ